MARDKKYRSMETYKHIYRKYLEDKIKCENVRMLWYSILYKCIDSTLVGHMIINIQVRISVLVYSSWF